MESLSQHKQHLIHINELILTTILKVPKRIWTNQLGKTLILNLFYISIPVMSYNIDGYT